MEIKTIAISAISLNNRLQKDDFYNFCKYDTFISTSEDSLSYKFKKIIKNRPKNSSNNAEMYLFLFPPLALTFPQQQPLLGVYAHPSTPSLWTYTHTHVH